MAVKYFFPERLGRVVKNTRAEKVSFLSKCVGFNYVNQNKSCRSAPSPVEKPVNNVEKFDFSTAISLYFPSFQFPVFDGKTGRIFLPRAEKRHVTETGCKRNYAAVFAEIVSFFSNGV